MIGEQYGASSSASVPQDHWTKEVSLWFAAHLATVQYESLQFVVKPWPPGHPEVMYKTVNLSQFDKNYEMMNVTKEKEIMCRNQLIRSSAAVQNFGVLSLTIVLVFCTAIIITALSLPSCVKLNRRRRMQKYAKRRMSIDKKETNNNSNSSRPPGIYADRAATGLSAAAEASMVARHADEKYSILAMALKGTGIGEWKRSRADIPITKEQTLVRPPVLDRDGTACFRPQLGSSQQLEVNPTPKHITPDNKLSPTASEGEEALESKSDQHRHQNDNNNNPAGNFPTEGKPVVELDRSFTEQTLVAAASPTVTTSSLVSPGLQEHA